VQGLSSNLFFVDRPHARASAYSRQRVHPAAAHEQDAAAPDLRGRWIGATSLYGKIDFLHRQAELLAGAHEQRLPSKQIERLFLSSDRQDYLVNWTDRSDKRPVQLTTHSMYNAT
jgi:hypothetical protein